MVTAGEGRKVKLPVAYVPGFLSPAPYSWYFRLRFEQRGYDFYKVRFPRLASGDMFDLALALETQVETLAERVPAGRVNLVCHSAGGLIARFYIQRLKKRAPVACVVFLGTPHQGTYAAYPGLFAAACRQMVPGSRFMKELDGNLGQILTNRSKSIYSRRDRLVIPAESGRLIGALNEEVRGLLGHTMLLSPRAFNIAISFIEQMAPVGDQGSPSTAGRLHK